MHKYWEKTLNEKSSGGLCLSDTTELLNTVFLYLVPLYCLIIMISLHSFLREIQVVLLEADWQAP